MTSIETTGSQPYHCEDNILVDQESQTDLIEEQDHQEKNNQLQIDLAVLKFVIGAVIFDTIFFLIF